MSTLIAFLKAIAALFGFGKAAVEVGGVVEAGIAGAEVQKARDEKATVEGAQQAQKIDSANEQRSTDELRSRVLTRPGS